jgi:hypothetical protein
MSLRRVLYHLGKTCEQGVALSKCEDAWTHERLAAEIKRLARKESRMQPGIGSGAVDTQPFTLERITLCAALLAG